MIIQHNVSALTTLNKLQRNHLESASSMKKLSSGLRINSAADDAAGLAISEKMRAQIRGLQQAERNIQDGISLIQVAEGALGEIQDINQRMRELVIQGANDTLTDYDRAVIQEELNQLKKGIENISSNTEFNKINLLDGSLEKKIDSSLKTPLGFEWKVDFNSPIQLTSVVSTTDGGMIVGGTSDIGASDHSPNDRSPYLAKLDSQGKVEWELKIPKDGEYNIVYDIKRLNNSEEFILTTRSRYELSGVGYNKNIFYKVDNAGNLVTKIDHGYDNYSYSINQSEDGTFVETGLQGTKIFVRTFDSNFNATSYKTYNHSSGTVRAGLDIKKTSDGGYILAGMENDSGNKNGLLIKLNSDLTVEWEKVVSNESFSSVVELNNEEFMVLGSKLYKFDSAGNYGSINNDISYPINSHLLTSGNITETQDGNYLISSGTQFSSNQNKIFKVDEGGNEILNISMEEYDFHLNAVMHLENGDYVAVGDNEVFKYTSDSYSELDLDPTLYIQTSANGDGAVGINIDSMKPINLGFTDEIPSVLLREVAMLSIERIDKAIEMVSKNRSTLGALQNGLEHSLRNSINYEENLTAAESRIRDVDYALAA